MTKCANCGTQNNGGAKFCKSCGTALAQAIPSPEQTSASNNCPACASPVVPGARFCKKCGTGLTDHLTLAAEPAARVTESVGVPLVRPDHHIVSAAPAAPEKPVKEVSSACPDVDAVTKMAATPAASTVPTRTVPVAEAPVSPRPVAAAAVSAPSTSGSASNGKTKGSRYILVGIGAVVLVGLVCVGSYWWSRSHKSTDTVPPANAGVPQTPAPMPTSPVAPAEPLPPSAPERSASSGADVPAQPAPPAVASPPATPTAEASDAVRAAKPAQPKRAAPAPHAEARLALRSPQSDGLNEKVATMLSKGDSYIANQQYDKAVATGESVLVLDPDNATAKALIKRAKAKQLDALKSGTSLD